MGQQNLRLGEQFFNEIIRHPVPINMNTLTALKRSPLGLDLYLWRCTAPSLRALPNGSLGRALYRQFGVDPHDSGRQAHWLAFRTDCLRELKKIKISLAGVELRDGQGRPESS